MSDALRSPKLQPWHLDRSATLHRVRAVLADKAAASEEKPDSGEHTSGI